MTTMTTEAPPPLGDCRVCGTPSWRADERGPVHLCCARVPDGGECRACAGSQAAGRDSGRRTRRMADVRARQAKTDPEETP